MSSQEQLRANQQNAQKSTGPRTEEGKAKARYNARRHGLTGQFYVMDDDDRQAYFAFEKGLFNALAPVGEYEHQLAISIAQDHWRMNRVKGIEFNTMGLGHHELAPEMNADSPETETAITQAKTWRSDNKAFANMALYETRLHRIINRNKRELNELQTKRLAAEAKAREEAELFLAYELSKSLPPNEENIQVNGFVFSVATIYEDLAWQQTLAEARFYKANNWDRSKPLPFKPLSFPKAA